MKTPLTRIRRGAVALVVIFVLAVCGYRFLDHEGKSTWLGDIYMVVITIATVGYGERSQFGPAQQLWTIAVILFGMTAAGYTLGGLLQLITAGEIERTLGVRRMTREIAKLSGHVVVCGYGRMGRILVEQLSRQGQRFVVIDLRPERVQEALATNLLMVSGDATEESTLLAAGIERARVLVTALPGDAENVFITLSARNLNPRLLIIARGEQPSTQQKLRQAGADRVVMTASIGARWIASMITRPSTVEFLELVADTATLDAELDEIVLSEGNPLVGRSVAEVVADWPHSMLIVAVKVAGGKMIFRPDATHVLRAGDTLILLGEVEAIRRFRQREGL